MITKTLIIKNLSRFPKTGSFDELTFEQGVNVLVGNHNTGKTQWLLMLNYLMGDSDGNPANAFHNDLVQKYDSISGIFLINGEEISLERRWKEPGMKGKVFINGEPISAKEFSSHLMSKLNIPLLHYPQGNPLSPRTWPELSWRSLLRHIYRNQKSWSEIISKQPEIEQHACLMLFLGIAEYLFSNTYEQLVSMQKEFYRKQVEKEQFMKTLNQISKEIMNEQELGVALTSDSINAVLRRIDTESEELANQREELLNSLRDEVIGESQMGGREFERLARIRSEILVRENEAAEEIRMTQARLRELREYFSKIEDEVSRVERAKMAGEVFRELRVTHCPVCEKPVKSGNRSQGHCYLCGQTNDTSSPDVITSEQRLEFEIRQLREEKKEAEELIHNTSNFLDEKFQEQRSISEEFLLIESQIRPIQSMASAIMPPEISLIDMELGGLQERKRQLERIKGLLDLQENLSEQIDSLEHELNRLEIEVKALSNNINFEQVGDVMVANINTYLNAIRAKNPKSWTHGQVGLRLKERSFTFTVGENKLASIGATLSLYFYVAYNYALLALSNKEQFHYPGLTILEFPPTFEDGSSVADKENFIIEPFVELLGHQGMENTQVIAVGSSFKDLQGAHRVELSHIWQ